jgi:hypothetical protein
MQLNRVAELHAPDDEGPVDDSDADSLVDVGELPVSGLVAAAAHPPNRDLPIGVTAVAFLLMPPFRQGIGPARRRRAEHPVGMSWSAAHNGQGLGGGKVVATTMIAAR